MIDDLHTIAFTWRPRRWWLCVTSCSLTNNTIALLNSSTRNHFHTLLPGALHRGNQNSKLLGQAIADVQAAQQHDQLADNHNACKDVQRFSSSYWSWCCCLEVNRMVHVLTWAFHVQIRRKLRNLKLPSRSVEQLERWFVFPMLGPAVTRETLPAAQGLTEGVISGYTAKSLSIRKS